MTDNILQQFRAILSQLQVYIECNVPTITCDGSQGTEDLVLAQLLPEQTGTYVDIGAFDPVQCSNTWQFYKRGWRGLLVEPLAYCLPRLLRHRPGDAVLPVALSNQACHALLRVNGSVSSFEADWPITPQAHHIVEMLTTREALALYPDIRDSCQLCSIDTEGHEKQVLEGIDFSLFHPRVFIVEAIQYHPEHDNVERWADWEPILLNNGYEFICKTKLNRIYMRPPEPEPEATPNEGEHADEADPAE